MMLAEQVLWALREKVSFSVVKLYSNAKFLDSLIGWTLTKASDTTLEQILSLFWRHPDCHNTTLEPVSYSCLKEWLDSLSIFIFFILPMHVDCMYTCCSLVLCCLCQLSCTHQCPHMSLAIVVCFPVWLSHRQGSSWPEYWRFVGMWLKNGPLLHYWVVRISGCYQ